ncbi:hypothetical protein NUU61_003492, partial [Penicillium alfredii]
ETTLRQNFNNFNVIQSVYKNVDQHGIRSNILTPISLPTSGQRPVIARVYGGGLFRGDSIYADWFPTWLLQLSEAHAAVIVSPNYRFLAEANVAQFLKDMHEFWSWLHSDDFAHPLTPHHVSSISLPGQIESSDLDLKRIRLQSAISQHKRGPELYARDSENSPCRGRLFQLARLDQPDTKLPRGGLVIMHGVDDGMVVPLASERFVEKARATMQGRQGGKTIVLSLRPGDHGFDVNSSLEDEWLKEALKTAVERSVEIVSWGITRVFVQSCPQLASPVFSRHAYDICIGVIF